MSIEIYIDTHIITLFDFMDHPEKFLPPGEAKGAFYLCMPVLRELELIKDNHISKGQRTRARKFLNLFTSPDLNFRHVNLTDNVQLKMDLGEPLKNELDLFSLITPDDQLVGKVHDRIRYGTNTVYLLTNDGGVILRAKYGETRTSQGGKIICYSPPEELRLNKDDDGFSQNMKNLLRQISLEIATELKAHLQSEGGEPGAHSQQNT